MKRAMILASAVTVRVVLLSGGTEAQNTAQTVGLVKLDGGRVPYVQGHWQQRRQRYRRTHRQDRRHSGFVSDGKQPYAVLSIGGFRGLGTHLVVVPYDDLTAINDKVTLPGGTKDRLETASVQIRCRVIAAQMKQFFTPMRKRDGFPCQ